MISSLRLVAHTAKGRLADIVKRRRFLSSIQPSDIFVVSYPRSGTTWLGFLLANLLKPDPDEEVHPPNRYAPDINGAYFGNDTMQQWAHLPAPRFLRVHAPYDPAFAKVIYVLRDPRDVMVSYYHFKRLTDPDFELSVMDFVSHDDHWPCRWDEHVAGWLHRRRHPHLLLLRYEEMRKDTVRVLRSVLNFVRLTYAEEEVVKAVQASEFDKMGALEAELRIAAGAVGMNEERVIRRGKVGGWRNELDIKNLQVVEGKYGQVMRKLGYDLHDGRIIDGKG